MDLRKLDIPGRRDRMNLEMMLSADHVYDVLFHLMCFSWRDITFIR